MTVASLSPAPRVVAGVLGVIGILGGLGVLAAFVVTIPPAVNVARIVLFYAAAIAVTLAVHPLHAAVSRRLALAAAVPLVLANGWSLAWFLGGLGLERPFAGAFGLVGFYAGLAAWIADAWFGLVALRIGVLWRPATVALVVGSVLAITGIDRLGLTSSADPTVFGPVSLLGIALNATAWVALGTQLVLAGRRPGRLSQAPEAAV
jgi:hypothetical protein